VSIINKTFFYAKVRLLQFSHLLIIFFYFYGSSNLKCLTNLNNVFGDAITGEQIIKQ